MKNYYIIIELKDTDGKIWSSDFNTPAEAIAEIKAVKASRGWKLHRVTIYK